MIQKRLILIIACILVTSFSSSVVSSQKRAALNAEQQKKFLARRLPSGAIAGTFRSFGSLLYAAQNIAIHTDDKHF